MDTRDRAPLDALTAAVLAQAPRFDFFQAVRLLELARPETTALGTGADPSAEALRLRSKVGLHFSPGDVVRGGVNDGYGRAVLEVAFMGLAGADGPLPVPYCELVLDNARPDAGDDTFDAAQLHQNGGGDDARDFLDIFNHRLISFLYRIRKKHSLALGATTQVAGQRGPQPPLLTERLAAPPAAVTPTAMTPAAVTPTAVTTAAVTPADTTQIDIALFDAERAGLEPLATEPVAIAPADAIPAADAARAIPAARPDPLAGSARKVELALLERMLFQLIGFNEGVEQTWLRRPGAPTAPPVPLRPLLRYAGILANPIRSMASLETMLSDAFGVRVRGEEDIGRWLPVEPRYQTKIGALGGQNCRLGEDTMLGTRAWDASAAIGLTIGPLTVAQFRDFEPGGASCEALTFMTRFYLRAELDVIVTLILGAGTREVAGIAALGSGRLGRGIWLRAGGRPVAVLPRRRGEAARRVMPATPLEWRHAAPRRGMLSVPAALAFNGARGNHRSTYALPHWSGSMGGTSGGGTAR